MNEELQAAITEILNSAISAKEFIVAELPEYISQLLMWHATHSLVMTFLGISIAIVVVYLNYRQIRFLRSESGKEFMRIYDILLIFNVLQILFLIPICNLINIEWLKIWIAPKVWLIEYLATIAK